MKVKLIVLLLIFLSSTVNAHSGRLDKRGGHKCSAKSKSKGLCSGYHYHKKVGSVKNKSINLKLLPEKVSDSNKIADIKK